MTPALLEQDATPSLTSGPTTGRIAGHGESRPPDRPRLRVPASRGSLDGPHARRIGDGLRRQGPDAPGTRRACRESPASRAGLPAAPGLRSPQPGPAGVDGRPPLQPLL